MGLFEHFPYTNFHELNAHWLLEKVRELLQRMTQAEADIDVLEGRCDSLEERMTTAEGDIDALEGRCDSLEERMTTAENDIDALEGRCDSLEERMTTAENDIDALEGRCSALELKTPIYIMYSAENIPDPSDYRQAIEAGKRPVYLRLDMSTANISRYYDLPLHQASFADTGSQTKMLNFVDPTGDVATYIGAGDNQGTYVGPCIVSLRTTSAFPDPAYYITSAGIPNLDNNANKVLTVNNNGTGVIWDT